MRIRLLALSILVVVAGSKASGVAAVPFGVTPVSSGNVTGAPIIINSSSGDQTDPHVDGDLAAYADTSGPYSVIRYYDFLTSAPGSILAPGGSSDQLSDVNLNHISFARQTGLSRSAQVFDVITWSTVQIGPD